MWKTVKPQQLGLGLIGLGLLFILLGWNGAAGKACIDCQLPYIISGGAGGLAFIGLGAALLLFESSRRANAHLQEKIDLLIDAVRQNGDGSSNGAATAAPKTRKQQPASFNGMVVVGRASFHRIDCRLVEGKEDLDYASPEDAVARGLQPCRVCAPAKVAR